MASAAPPLSALCAYAFDVIANTFDGSVALVPPTVTTNDKFPMFVTWKKRETADEKNWRLRGCIGTFGAQPLLEGIKKYAHISAFKDTRFKPVTAGEVPKLCCHVSLLTNFEPAKDCYDWKVGTHGIQIDFHVGSESYNATYLPEVAKEQGWSHEETITELVAKSGYDGPVTAALRAAIKLTRYQSQKATLTYTEYVALRKPPASSSSSSSSAAAATTNGVNGNANGSGGANGVANGKPKAKGK